ncbi:DNA-processing protein DprA [Metapseudomonas otitidis]|uniref:DNA-processing protein DprA n=1 Tax=Metapseudomonas otitidis TaxID=319939 RepID=UPI001F15C35E|nr:DNA-processing protein DprA [Pseudomonas otitidis]
MDDKEFWRNEKVAFLALTTLKGVGFWTLYKVAQSGLGFKECLRSPQGTLLEKAIHESRLDQTELWSAGLELARQLTAVGVMLFFKGEKAFPSRLRSIPDAPEWIFIQGSVEILSRYSIAVVGTRKPTEDGCFLAKYVVATLASLSCVTISGLAVGIDQLAHLESLRYGIPTVAVLGTGILQNYPKGSEALRHKIIESGGSIVTEYLPSQLYSAENFVRRNRIQAALCNVLVPVEWGIKSGTAHTVKYAHVYGRKIINVYLPYTLADRPEIIFSAEEYASCSFELPQLHDFFQALLFSESLSVDAGHTPVEVDAGFSEDDLDGVQFLLNL